MITDTVYTTNTAMYVATRATKFAALSDWTTRWYQNMKCSMRVSRDLQTADGAHVAVEVCHTRTFALFGDEDLVDSQQRKVLVKVVTFAVPTASFVTASVGHTITSATRTISAATNITIVEEFATQCHVVTACPHL